MTAYNNGVYLFLYEILELVNDLNNKKTLYVVCNEFGKCGFDYHYQAYLVVRSAETLIQIFPVTNFIGPPIHIHKLKNNAEAIRLKNYF